MVDDLRDRIAHAMAHESPTVYQACNDDMYRRLADIALAVVGPELERLRKELAGTKAAFDRAWEVHGEICSESELAEQRQRAEQAEAERDELRDTLDATMRNFEDYVEQLRDAEAERDALKAALEGFANILDGIADGLESCYSEYAAHSPRALVRSMRRTLATPTPTEETGDTP